MRSFWLRPLERHVAFLSGESSRLAYQQLIDANGLLIALVTAYAVLTVWMWWRIVWPPTIKTRDRSLLLVRSALGFYAVGSIWLVQLVSYRLWPYVGRQEAYAYHIAWWHSIWGVLFIHAGVVLLGSLGMLWIRPEGISRRTARVGFALQVLIYVVTGAWFAPDSALGDTRRWTIAALVSPAYDNSLGAPWAFHRIRRGLLLHAR